MGTITSTKDFSDLKITPDSKEDWFKFTLSSAGTSDSSITINYTHENEVDLNLKLYNGSNSADPIGNSELSTGKETISLSGLAAGTYYINIYQNSDTPLSDSTTYSLSVTTTPHDLQTTVGGKISATRVEQGKSFTLSDVPISYIGTEDSGSYTITYYASIDSVINTSDISLGTYSMTSLRANSNTTVSQIFNTMNLAVDTSYYIGWIITSTGDSDPSNNIGHTTDTVTITPDLSQYEYAAEDCASLQAFLEQVDSDNIKNGTRINLYYDADDPTTWTGVTWNIVNGEKHVTDIKWTNKRLVGNLDLSGCTALETLDCCSNQLTQLNVSKNKALIILDCNSNLLTELNVSDSNTELTILNCSFNQFTELDVTKNKALKELDCRSNKLTSLDVTVNTALKELNCDYNLLTELDVSKNVALEYLYLNNNKLTSLDISNNTALKYLFCYSNELTSLDVSVNKALVLFDCHSNQLTSLDVTVNTELKYLYCNYNGLTSLDVTVNTKLVSLYCCSNKLTSLDVTKNVELTSLDCSSNELTFLNVSKNTALVWLRCGSNELYLLDITKNKALENLYCGDNTSLNYVVVSESCLGKVNLSFYTSIYDQSASYQWKDESNNVLSIENSYTPSSLPVYGEVYEVGSDQCKQRTAFVTYISRINVRVILSESKPVEDIMTELADSLTETYNGRTVYAQVWIKNNDGSPYGIVGGYMDIAYSDAILTNASVTPGANFASQADKYTINPGNIATFGWMASEDQDKLGVGDWVLLGYTTFTVKSDESTDQTAVISTGAPSSEGETKETYLFTRSLEGNIESDNIDFGSVTLTVHPTEPLLVPENIATASAGANRVTVSWNAVENATGYTVFWSTDQETWTEIAATETSTVVTGLTYGALTYYRVKAVGDGISYSDSDYSVAISKIVCPMDIDGDGRIGPSDMNALSSAWFTRSTSDTWDPRCDIDSDGTIGPSDMSYLYANWFKKSSTATIFPAAKADLAQSRNDTNDAVFGEIFTSPWDDDEEIFM